MRQNIYRGNPVQLVKISHDALIIYLMIHKCMLNAFFFDLSFFTLIVNSEAQHLSIAIVWYWTFQTHRISRDFNNVRSLFTSIPTLHGFTSHPHSSLAQPFTPLLCAPPSLRSTMTFTSPIMAFMCTCSGLHHHTPQSLFVRVSFGSICAVSGYSVNGE